MERLFTVETLTEAIVYADATGQEKPEVLTAFRDALVREKALQAERDALIADNASLRERGPIDWREGPPPDDLKGTPVLIDGISGPHVAVWFDRYKTWWVGNNVDGFGGDLGDATRHCPVTP